MWLAIFQYWAWQRFYYSERLALSPPVKSRALTCLRVPNLRELRLDAFRLTDHDVANLNPGMTGELVLLLVHSELDTRRDIDRVQHV